MSCCPGIRCKNTGSGYVKPDGSSESAKDLDARMNALLEARRTMDIKIWGNNNATTQPEKIGGAQPILHDKKAIY